MKLLNDDKFVVAAEVHVLARHRESPPPRSQAAVANGLWLYTNGWCWVVADEWSASEILWITGQPAEYWGDSDEYFPDDWDEV